MQETPTIRPSSPPQARVETLERPATRTVGRVETAPTREAGTRLSTINECESVRLFADRAALV